MTAQPHIVYADGTVEPLVIVAIPELRRERVKVRLENGVLPAHLLRGETALPDELANAVGRQVETLSSVGDGHDLD